MVVTEEGMVKKPLKPEQKANALEPMVVTDEGIAREPVKPEQK
jgi:hypothetical protein